MLVERKGGRISRILGVAGVLWIAHLGLLVCCGAGKAKKPQITLGLLVAPQIGFSPLTVTVSGLVKDPGRELHCPGFAWDWGEGTRSTELADCDPYAMPEKEPESYAPIPRVHRYSKPGDYTLTFVVADGFTRRETSRTVRVLPR